MIDTAQKTRPLKIMEMERNGVKICTFTMPAATPNYIQLTGLLVK